MAADLIEEALSMAGNLGLPCPGATQAPADEELDAGPAERPHWSERPLVGQPAEALLGPRLTRGLEELRSGQAI